jgi:hypothetical protein
MSTILILLTSGLRRSAVCILGSWCLLLPLASLFGFGKRSLAPAIVSFLMLGALIYGAIYWAYFHGWKKRVESIGKDVFVGWAIIVVGAVLLGLSRGLAGLTVRISPAWYLGFLVLGFVLLEWTAGRARTNAPVASRTGFDAVSDRIIDAITSFARSLTGLRKGELALLWTCGLLTTFSLIAIADNPENFHSATGTIAVIWIICGLVWVSFYRRRRRADSHGAVARPSIALMEMESDPRAPCSRCLHSWEDHIDEKRAEVGRCRVCACLCFAAK